MAITIENFLGGVHEYLDTDGWNQGYTEMYDSTHPYPNGHPCYILDLDNSFTHPLEITLPWTSASPTGNQAMGLWVRFGGYGSTFHSYIQPFVRLSNLGIERFGSSGWLSITSGQGLGASYLDQDVATSSNNVWYFFELYVGSDGCKVWRNGTELYSGAALTRNYTYDPRFMEGTNYTVNGNGMYVQAAYTASGLTSSADVLVGPKPNQGIRVYGYKSEITTAVPDSGTTLDVGVWSDAEGSTNLGTSAEYTGGTSAGYLICDGSGGSETTGGLAVDQNVDRIAGVKLSSIISRSGGGGTTFWIRAGSSPTTTTSLNIGDPTQSQTQHILVVPATDSNCPDVNDTGGPQLCVGFEKDTGGQNMEIWSFMGTVLAYPGSVLSDINDIPASDISAINDISFSNITYINDMNIT